MSLASVVSTSSSSSTTSSNSALNSLSSNFNSFLQLLMTQLQNQDPTSPVDTDQFTQELVEFSGVQQQVDTNTNLSSLIQLTQGDSVIQGSSLVGQQVTATTSDITLQNSTGSVNFTAPAAEDATVTVSDSAGNVLDTSTVSAASGSNSWSWNGANSDGGTEPDGNYTISVTDPSGNALATTITGTASGVSNNSGTIDITVGNQTVPLANVTSVSSGSGGTSA
jgi:flagellar basal-body rod modification protein FlgD